MISKFPAVSVSFHILLSKSGSVLNPPILVCSSFKICKTPSKSCFLLFATS
ncbi:MAG: hypothetical protein LBC61_02365 [Candidatus Peribacteria bacterium]|nr:hypothetical protein [Candidatus Peribacteria bacterium]